MRPKIPISLHSNILARWWCSIYVLHQSSCMILHLAKFRCFYVWSHEFFALRTQDPVTIYWANIAVLTACYGYGFTIGKPDGDEAADQNQPQWLKFIYKVGYRIPSVLVDCSACASRGVELPLAVE